VRGGVAADVTRPRAVRVAVESWASLHRSLAVNATQSVRRGAARSASSPAPRLLCAHVYVRGERDEAHAAIHRAAPATCYLAPPRLPRRVALEQ